MSNGIVPAIYELVEYICKPDEKVLFLSPSYAYFKHAAEFSGREFVCSPLNNSDGYYTINFEDFEKRAADEKTTLFIFCNPHNPSGRVWKEEEIRKVLDICKKHRVYVIADEIHQDMIMTGHRHVVAASTGDYDEILITLTAATKTFNLAACQNSILIIPDETLREKYDEYLNRLRIKGGNAFGYIAVQSAYENGREWLEEVLEIIEGNYHYLRETLEKELPKVWISKLEGTYLMWIDLGEYIRPEEMETVICDKCGLGVDYGAWFGSGESERFIRVNLATSRENIETAAQRIIDVLKK